MQTNICRLDRKLINSNKNNVNSKSKLPSKSLLFLLQQIFLLQFHTYFSMNQIQQQTVDYTANDG